MFFLHDFTHAARIAEMSLALGEGDFPVQWSKNFGYGYGMPLFLFYGPLAYYVGAILYGVSGSIVWSTLILFVLANGITLAGSYLLGKAMSGRLGGLLFSILVTLAPYRAVNLFLRGALNEAWAMAFLTWLLFGWWLLMKKHRFGWILITLSTAAILLTHNLSAIYFLPFGVVSGVAFFVWQHSTTRVIPKQLFQLMLRGLASSVLGVGLSAFYVIPALLQKSLTRLDQQVLTGYFDYHNHFLYLRQFFLDKWRYGGSEWGPNDGISFFLGYGVLLGLLLAVLLLFKMNHAAGAKHKRLVIIFFGFLLILTMLFTTQKTLWFWENLSFLPYLQFPWRLLSLIGAIASLIIGLVSSEIFPHRKLVLGALIMLTMATSFRYFAPAFYYGKTSGPYYADADRIQKEMSGILPDYLPQNFNTEIAPYENLVTDSDVIQSSILKDAASEKLVSIEAKEDTLLTISIANFLGWQAYINGMPVDTIASDDGLMQVPIPEGKQLLSLKFESTLAGSIANGISAISLFLIVALLYSQIASQTKKA